MSKQKVTARIWVMKHLSKMANDLDAEDKFVGARLVDQTMNKIAQMDDDDFDKFFDDPDMDFGDEDTGEANPFAAGENRYETGGVTGDVVPLGADPLSREGDDLESWMAAFIDGLADGMYERLEDAMAEARSISQMYAKKMEEAEMDEPAPMEPELPGAPRGQVLSFPPRED